MIAGRKTREGAPSFRTVCTIVVDDISPVYQHSIVSQDSIKWAACTL